MIKAPSSSQRGKKGEARLPPAAAMIVAIILYALLPQSLVLGPRLLVPSLELVLLVVLVATNPWRVTKQTRWTRAVSLTLAARSPGCRPSGKICRWPTSGSARPRTGTLWLRSATDPARSPIGFPPSWTTCMCGPPIPGLQPHRHHAADQSRQDPGGHPGHRRPPHLPTGDFPGLRSIELNPTSRQALFGRPRTPRLNNPRRGQRRSFLPPGLV